MNSMYQSCIKNELGELIVMCSDITIEKEREILETHPEYWIGLVEINEKVE